MKRTQTAYFRSNVCYGDVEFRKPKAVRQFTLTKTTSDLVGLAAKERMCDGGYQANPFLQYMECVNADPWIGERRTLDHAATVFQSYVCMMGCKNANDSVVSFETSGFKGGMFSRVKFVGPLEPMNEWLQITEEPLKSTEYNHRFQPYHTYCYTFTVIGCC